MRVAGIVLLTIAAVLIVPPLAFAGFKVATDNDPYRIYVALAVQVAALGGCLAAVGAILVAVARGRRGR